MTIAQLQHVNSYMWGATWTSCMHTSQLDGSQWCPTEGISMSYDAPLQWCITYAWQGMHIYKTECIIIQLYVTTEGLSSFFMSKILDKTW